VNITPFFDSDLGDEMMGSAGFELATSAMSGRGFGARSIIFAPSITTV
jgi:hypothetical protein